MEILVDGVLKARKFPFIFSFFILLLFLLVSFLFLSNSQTQIPVSFDLAAPQSSIITESASLSPEAPLISSAPEVALPLPPPSFHKTDKGVPENATTKVADLKWSKCIGPVAVDYIPCLDNYKLMKTLKGKRKIERKERHCPQPSPRCLVPLPQGYKIPVLWPESRDRVRYNWYCIVQTRLKSLSIQLVGSFCYSRRKSRPSYMLLLLALLLLSS